MTRPAVTAILPLVRLTASLCVIQNGFFKKSNDEPFETNNRRYCRSQGQFIQFSYKRLGSYGRSSAYVDLCPNVQSQDSCCPPSGFRTMSITTNLTVDPVDNFVKGCFEFGNSITNTVPSRGENRPYQFPEISFGATSNNRLKSAQLNQASNIPIDSDIVLSLIAQTQEQHCIHLATDASSTMILSNGVQLGHAQSIEFKDGTHIVLNTMIEIVRGAITLGQVTRVAP